MPRMRGRLYSSCASSTCNLPSALVACCAKMSRISCVRSTTRACSVSSSVRCCDGSSSSSTRSTSAPASMYPRSSAGSGWRGITQALCPAMQVSPALRATGTYPFVKLEQARRRLADEGVELIDFGKGDPIEATDPAIRQALVDALEERMGYPLAEALPELRAAIAGWCRRRFGVELDPDREIVPTYGSKEAIFLLAQVVVDRDSEKRLVLTTEPGYPVPDRGATFAGAEVQQLPLLERHG